MSNEFYRWNTGANIQFTPHFNSSEFESPDCDKHKISVDLVNKLESLRLDYNRSITVTSGYRSKEHNAKVGGVENSQHVQGMAADLTGKDLDKLHELCLTIFNAIGDGRKKGKFIHVDVRTLPPGKKGPITFGY
jgi:uncharacterized protein YcbK (DUF882 family)